MDFNRTIHSATPINTAINDMIETAAARAPEVTRGNISAPPRSGASAYAESSTTGWFNSAHPLRTRDIFHRGHVF